MAVDAGTSKPSARAIVAGAVVVGALLGTLTGCGEDDQPTRWKHHGTEADLSTIESYRGAEHCGWQDVTFLNLRWPRDASGSERRMYVRDPDHVLASHTLGDFVGHAALPENAEYTGFSSETGELWLVPGDQEPFAYVVSDDNIEAWPRTNQVLGCD